MQDVSQIAMFQDPIATAVTFLLLGIIIGFAFGVRFAMRYRRPKFITFKPAPEHTRPSRKFTANKNN